MKKHLYKVGDEILTNYRMGWWPKGTDGKIEKLLWLCGEPVYQTSIPIGLITDESITLKFQYEKI